MIFNDYEGSILEIISHNEDFLFSHCSQRGLYEVI